MKVSKSIKPGALVRLQKDRIRYAATILCNDESFPSERKLSESNGWIVLLPDMVGMCISTTMGSKYKYGKPGVFLFGETLVAAYADIFEKVDVNSQ